MLQSLDEIKKIELPVAGIINGVDNANLMSVDSTEPIKTDVDTIPLEEEGKTVEVVIPAVIKEEGKDAAKDDTNDTELTAPEKKLDTVIEKTVPALTKDPVEKRIGKLTKNWRTAERALDNERIRRKAAEDKLKGLEAATPDTEKPIRVDYEEDVDFIEALTDWKVDARFKAQQGITDKDDAETVELEAIEQVEEELEVVSNRGREKHEDYDELVFAKELVLNQDIIEAVLLSEVPEEMFYYLGSNPDKAAELSKLSPVKTAKEIVKIEVELLAGIPRPNAVNDVSNNSEVEVKEVKSKPKRVTKAPEPIDTVKADGIVEKDPSDMSPKEYRQWRESKKE